MTIGRPSRYRLSFVSNVIVCGSLCAIVCVDGDCRGFGAFLNGPLFLTVL